MLLRRFDFKFTCSSGKPSEYICSALVTSKIIVSLIERKEEKENDRDIEKGETQKKREMKNE